MTTGNLINNLEAMLAKGQDNALLRFGLGNAYFQQKNFNKAALHLAAAIDFDKEYTAAWKLYGRVLVRLDEFVKAKQIFQQGIAIAEQKGYKQAAKEMQVFLKRLEKES